MSAAQRAVQVFLAFAFTYFFCGRCARGDGDAGARVQRRTRAARRPTWPARGGLLSRFAAMQLPLGRALDRFGPRRVLVALLSVAVLGCIGFALRAAWARSSPRGC